MDKTIDMTSQLLENNKNPLPKGALKKEGGSILENNQRSHALVVASSSSSYFIIDLGASRHMASMKGSLSAIHP